MAAGLLGHALPDLRFESAGLQAMAGYPADPLARQLMGERGIDIEGHVARQVTAKMCSAADLILVMDVSQKRAIEQKFISTRGKVFRLGEFLGEDIFDPYRSGRAEFERCLSLIEQSVGQWVPRIENAL
jgi:protein-tyrosine phosphatase